MSAVLRAEAAAKFPTNGADGKHDPLAWAKRFVYRAERGDRDLLPIQIAQAYQALGLEPNKKDTTGAK